MDESKSKTSTNKKEAKVGADGLTKKERRATKVQSRPDANSTTNVNKNLDNKPSDKKVAASTQIKNSKSEVKLGKTKTILEKTENTDIKQTASVDLEKSNTKTEKELRKLEWEKKLAAQKLDKSKEGSLSKAELKAKRREQQEAQRIAKTNQAEQKPKVEKTTPAEKQPDKKVPDIKKSPIVKTLKKSNISKVLLVNHLYIEEYKKIGNDNIIVNYKGIHPEFIKLGAQYSNKIVLGSNARCLALLSAINTLVQNLQTPPKQEFCRYLESVVQNCVEYLHQCRPLAVCMMNALRHFKLQVTKIDNNLSDKIKKQRLEEVIHTYIEDEILTAAHAISLKVNEKISDGDVILTYGCSSLIRRILLDAHKEQKNFEVIVVDGRPLLEGREMLRRLTSQGIKCTYVLINAVSFVMNSVSKVLLGAHALLTNGYVMSRIGTAQVALVAQVYNKPVLVCCETYKFSERVQTDSFVYNEIGDPDKLVTIDTQEERSPLANIKENNKLRSLSLLYDVTPADLVTAVVTELAFLPCTSVPVVLRIKPTEAA